MVYWNRTGRPAAALHANIRCGMHTAALHISITYNGEPAMKVSTKGRYALRVMIEIATYDPAEYVPLRALAESQDISEKYLEAIIAPMVRAGLLAGQRGKGGGYKLAKAPSEYTAGEILRVAEGSLAPVSCLEGATNVCPRAGKCATLDLWQGLDVVINNYLEGITLEDLRQKEMPAGGDYVI